MKSKHKVRRAKRSVNPKSAVRRSGNSWRKARRLNQVRSEREQTQSVPQSPAEEPTDGRGKIEVAPVDLPVESGALSSDANTGTVEQPVERVVENAENSAENNDA